MARALRHLRCSLRPRSTDELMAALEEALRGTGPAILPLPETDPAAAARAVAALRPDDVSTPVGDDIAAVVATSGSTGPPKGVLLPAMALRASAEATLDRLGGPGQWLLALSPTHIAGLQVLVRSLVGGVRPVTLDASAGFDGASFTAATQRLDGPRRYTSLVPTQLVRVLDAGAHAVAAASTYDAILLGGAAAPAALLERAAAAGLRVVTSYGMSETSGGCVYDGAPLAGVTVELDGAGRVVLGGPVLAAGYRLRPDLTAEAFADGRFRTSDLGRFGPDGRLVVLGRSDDVIVTGGEKVSAAGVEEVLASQPGVREVAVVGAPDEEWGQRVVAFVVAKSSAAVAPDELRRAVGDALGRTAAPREVYVIDALPLLASSKVDRQELVRRTKPA